MGPEQRFHGAELRWVQVEGESPIVVIIWKVRGCCRHRGLSVSLCILGTMDEMVRPGKDSRLGKQLPQVVKMQNYSNKTNVTFQNVSRFLTVKLTRSRINHDLSAQAEL